MIPLSQSHLTHLDICARKYQYVFFDALLGPSTYDQHLTTQWGSQFHLLMQQQALDLPVEVITPADMGMANSLAALEKAAPDVFAYLPESSVSKQVFDEKAEPADPNIFSQSEHRRTLEFNGYLLTVIYDLLVTSAGTPEHPDSGQIFDWKTHQQPPKQERLQKDWQTRLYLYVLCETSELAPEQISMTYWFVRTEDKTPSFYRFDYTLAQHDVTRKDLQQLTDGLTQMREQTDFPKVAVEKGYCVRCPFDVRCQRSHLTQPHKKINRPDPTQILKAARQLTAETVEEIPL